MAMLCLFGICIPYSVLWPLIVLGFRQLYVFFFGKPAKSLEPSTDSSKQKKDFSDSFGYIGYLTKDMDFDSLIKADRPTIVKFTATWCGPCKQVEPYFEEFAKENAKDGIFVSVDVDEFDDIAANHSAVTIPFFVCFKNGKEAHRHSGKDIDQLKKFINESLAKDTKETK
jgi:thioredoxin 1